MISVKGRLQREGEVIHVIADRLEDHTSLLHSVGALEFPHRPSPGDGATHGGPPDPRERWTHRPRDLYPAPHGARRTRARVGECLGHLGHAEDGLSQQDSHRHGRRDQAREHQRQP